MDLNLKSFLGTFLVVQWLRLYTSNARGTDPGTKILNAVQPKKNKAF